MNFMGKEYSSVDDMPADVRQMHDMITKTFADEDHDGVPDVFEGKENAHILNLHNMLMSQMQSGKILFDGKEISGIDQLPPDVRAKYEAALEKMRANPALRMLVRTFAGRALSNMNNLPPEVREKYQQALDKMQSNPYLSDLIGEAVQGTPPTPTMSSQFSSTRTESTPITSAPAKAFFSDTTMLLLGGLLIIVLLIAMGTAAFLLLGPLLFK